MPGASGAVSIAISASAGRKRALRFWNCASIAPAAPSSGGDVATGVSSSTRLSLAPSKRSHQTVAFGEPSLVCAAARAGMSATALQNVQAIERSPPLPWSGAPQAGQVSATTPPAPTTCFARGLSLWSAATTPMRPVASSATPFGHGELRGVAAVRASRRDHATGRVGLERDLADGADRMPGSGFEAHDRVDPVDRGREIIEGLVDRDRVLNGILGADVEARVATFRSLARRASEIPGGVRVRERGAERRRLERLAEAARRALDRAIDRQVIERREEAARPAGEAAAHRDPVASAAVDRAEPAPPENAAAQTPRDVRRAGAPAPQPLQTSTPSSLAHPESRSLSQVRRELPFDSLAAVRPVDVGQEATGFFAFGQFATGFIAIGQVAPGVIAIGQVARGVVAIGQVSFGLVFSAGMLSGGVLSTSGMIGVGGRRGIGGIIQLIPTIGKPRVAPPTAPFERVAAEGSGYVDATCATDAEGLPVLLVGGAPLPIKIDTKAAGAVLGLAPVRGEVKARIEKLDGILVCTRLVFVPEPPYKKKIFPVLAAAQLAGFAVLCVAWWIVVGAPVLRTSYRRL